LKLLDSNILIAALKGREPAVSRLREADPRELAVPAIVVYELEYGTLGAQGSRRKAMLNGLLSSLPEIPFDGPAAREAARIRAALERRGMTIGPLDLLIAGTAASRGAVLVTGNVKELERIEGLRLEDWTK